MAQVALTAGDPAEATAGAGVIAGFCEEYREGQQMLAATFTLTNELSIPLPGATLCANLQGLSVPLPQRKRHRQEQWLFWNPAVTCIIHARGTVKQAADRSERREHQLQEDLRGPLGPSWRPR